MSKTKVKRLPDELIPQVLQEFYYWEIPIRIDNLFYVGFFAMILETHNRAHIDHIVDAEAAEIIQTRDWIIRCGPSEDINEVVTEMAEYAAEHNLNDGFTKWYKKMSIK